MHHLPHHGHASKGLCFPALKLGVDAKAVGGGESLVSHDDPPAAVHEGVIHRGQENDLRADYDLLAGTIVQSLEVRDWGLFGS